MAPISTAPAIPKKTLGDGYSSLHHTTERLLNFKKNDFANIEAFIKAYELSIFDKEANKEDRKNSLFHLYRSLYDHHHALINEEKLISRMERKAQIRNTFFRGITTLVIGFSIMAVYYTASELGINMPLLRFGA